MSGVPPAPRSGPPRGLSPVPDDAMGQPAPPRAPRVLGPWAGHARSGRRTKSWRPARKTPYRRRTVLEFVSAKRQHGLRYHLFLSLGLLIAMIAFFYIDSLFHPADGDLEGELPIILVLWIIGAGLFYVISRRQAFYVGATWITEKHQVQREGEEVVILNMYELSKIRVDRASRSDAILRMVGRKKEYLEPPLGLLEGNPNLWDYVYNGLVHSAANGAEIDTGTRELLHLPGPGGAGV